MTAGDVDEFMRDGKYEAGFHSAFSPPRLGNHVRPRSNPVFVSAIPRREGTVPRQALGPIAL